MIATVRYLFISCTFLILGAKAQAQSPKSIQELFASSTETAIAFQFLNSNTPITVNNLATFVKSKGIPFVDENYIRGYLAQKQVREDEFEQLGVAARNILRVALRAENRIKNDNAALNNALQAIVNSGLSPNIISKHNGEAFANYLESNAPLTLDSIAEYINANGTGGINATVLRNLITQTNLVSESEILEILSAARLLVRIADRNGIKVQSLADAGPLKTGTFLQFSVPETLEKLKSQIGNLSTHTGSNQASPQSHQPLSAEWYDAYDPSQAACYPGSPSLQNWSDGWCPPGPSNNGTTMYPVQPHHRHRNYLPASSSTYSHRSYHHTGFRSEAARTMYQLVQGLRLLETMLNDEDESKYLTPALSTAADIYAKLQQGQGVGHPQVREAALQLAQQLKELNKVIENMSEIDDRADIMLQLRTGAGAVFNQ